MEEILESISLAVEPDKTTAGTKLFYVHLTGMTLMPLIFLSIPMLRIPIFISYVPLYIYHIIKKSCPVTRVERRLHHQDITVLDVFLKMVGIEPTRMSRNTMLIFLSTVFIIYMISIMST